MLVGISGQLLNAGQDLCQNGINLVILAKIITELWKRKRRKGERERKRERRREEGRDGGGKKDGRGGKYM